MSRDNFLWIYDMQEAMTNIFSFVNLLMLSDYLNDAKTIAAVERKVSIIGEAAAQLPEEFKAKYADVPWSVMKGFQNVLVHEYFGIDQSIVWRIIHNDLPGLKKQMDAIIALES